VVHCLLLLLPRKHVYPREELLLHHAQRVDVRLLLDLLVLDLRGHVARSAHEGFVGVALSVDHVDEVEVDEFDEDPDVQAAVGVQSFF